MAPFRPVRARAAPPGPPTITAGQAPIGRGVKVRDIDEECGKARPDVLSTAVASSGCACLLCPGAVLCLESPDCERSVRGLGSICSLLTGSTFSSPVSRWRRSSYGRGVAESFVPARHRGVRPGASSVYGGRWTNEYHPARRLCKITGRAGTIEKRVCSLSLFIIFPIHHVLADIETYALFRIHNPYNGLPFFESKVGLCSL